MVIFNLEDDVATGSNQLRVAVLLVVKSGRSMTTPRKWRGTFCNYEKSKIVSTFLGSYSPTRDTWPDKGSAMRPVARIIAPSLSTVRGD